MAPQKQNRDPLDDIEFLVIPGAEQEDAIRKRKSTERRLVSPFIDYDYIFEHVDDDDFEQERIYILGSEKPVPLHAFTWKLNNITYIYKPGNDRLTYSDFVEGFELENVLDLQFIKALEPPHWSNLRIILRTITRSRRDLVRGKSNNIYDYATEEDNPTVDIVEPTTSTEGRED